MHPARLPIDALLAQCEERRLRRSGPGGQNRNKVETAVVLLHTPTGISAEANERRSQQQNREMATTRLRVRLAVEWRETPEPSPSCLWLSRCKGGKLSVSDEHDDFPALLAEALDHIAAADWDEAAAAQTLGVTRTQLVNFLRQAPPALTRLNQERTNRNRPQVR